MDGDGTSDCSQEECCIATCAGWGGSCPADTTRRGPEDMHQCSDDNMDGIGDCGEDGATAAIAKLRLLLLLLLLRLFFYAHRTH